MIRTRDSWRLPLALAALIALALLPTALFTAWRVRADVNEERVRVESALSQSATALAQSATQELQSSLDALAVLGRSEIFQQERIRTMGRLLQGRPRRDWESLFLLDRRGAVVMDTVAARAVHESTADMAQLHARVLRDMKPLVATFGEREPGVVIALPVGQNGELHYVLGARIVRTTWQRVVDGASVPDGGRALIVDDRKRVIAASASGAPVERAATASIAPSGWQATVAIDGAPLAARQEAIVRNALATSGLGLLLGLLLAGLAAWRIAFVQARRAPAEL